MRIRRNIGKIHLWFFQKSSPEKFSQAVRQLDDIWLLCFISRMSPKSLELRDEAFGWSLDHGGRCYIHQWMNPLMSLCALRRCSLVGDSLLGTWPGRMCSCPHLPTPSFSASWLPWMGELSFTVPFCHVVSRAIWPWTEPTGSCNSNKPLVL